ncbi:low temperature requirement protein LtrA [Bradyrhizobium sp. USDA 4486]
MMLGGLVLSTTIPTAFEGRGLWFALAYATMQVGRTAFWMFATPRHRTAVRHNAIRILVWLCGSAVFWILGGLAHGQQRLWFWIAALTIEYVSPAVRFWVPKLGFSSVEAWAVEGGHMAERCAGFIIIALGEAIVVNGATFAELEWTADNILGFVSALVGSIAMWWVYFHKGAEAGSERISKSAESGRLARLAYTYLHTPIVAGIILTAVSDELVLKHPTGHSDVRTIVSTIGGPLVFLVGTILFKHSIRGFLQLSHGIGIILLLALWWFAADLSPLWLSVATSLILIVVAVWESVSLGSKAEEVEDSEPA